LQESGVIRSREIHLPVRPDGLPQLDQFHLVERELDAPKPGEVLVQNSWMSVDPYMRGRMTETPSYIPPFRLDRALEGGSVGQVIVSRNSSFAEGTWVLSMRGGWREVFRSTGADLRVIDVKTVPPQTWLGVLGLTGFTAYVGLIVLGRAQLGQTISVSAAAGAVGVTVSQIAKTIGCRVIGVAGGEDKCRWLGETLGLDAVIDYKAQNDLRARFQSACPEGLDVAFENVGGKPLEAALGTMKRRGRIVICGMIDGYNHSVLRPGPTNLAEIAKRSLDVHGFIASDYEDSRNAFERAMLEWHQSGAVQSIETIYDGLENAPRAFLDLFRGRIFGKMLVRLT
jgi:NADPH-dependent curcumin reductase CurA